MHSGFVCVKRKITSAIIISINKMYFDSCAVMVNLSRPSHLHAVQVSHKFNMMHMKHAFGTCVKCTKICNAMLDKWTRNALMYDFRSVNIACRDLAIAITAHSHSIY